MKINNFAFLLIVLCIATLLFPSAYCPQTLQLTTSTNKQSYELGENVQVQGNLTLDGSPVSNGLVAIQIDNHKGAQIVIRVLPTGTLPPQDWRMELVEVVPCDQQGNPKSSFQTGTTAYFKPTIRSTDNINRNVAVSLNLFYVSSMISIKAFFPLENYMIQPGETRSPILGVPIPSLSSTGNAIVYACVFTARPKDGGTAYSSEKSATFTITSTSSTTTTYTTDVANPTSTEGSYDLTFKLPSTNGVLGQYMIYANAMYKAEDIFPLVARASKSFEVTLTGDINGDGIVDYRDIGIIARAYGTVPGDLNWDPRADLIKDSIIDYRDISLCARNYGKSGTY